MNPRIKYLKIISILLIGSLGLINILIASHNRHNYSSSRINIKAYAGIDTIDNLWKNVSRIKLNNRELAHKKVEESEFLFNRKLPKNDFLLKPVKYSNSNGHHEIYMPIPKDHVTLRGFIFDNKDKSLKEKLSLFSKIFKDILKGLKVLEKLNIIHTNINPDNILIENRNDFSKRKPLIINFERAFFTSDPPKREKPKNLKKSPYDSPEIKKDTLFANLNNKTDIYSFGRILLEVFNIEDSTISSELFDDYNHRKEIYIIEAIQSSMEENVEDRISIDNLMLNPFFNSLNSNSTFFSNEKEFMKWAKIYTELRFDFTASNFSKITETYSPITNEEINSENDTDEGCFSKFSGNNSSENFSNQSIAENNNADEGYFLSQPITEDNNTGEGYFSKFSKNNSSEIFRKLIAVITIVGTYRFFYKEKSSKEDKK